MKRLLSVVILLLASNAYALDWQDSPEVGKGIREFPVFLIVADK